MKKSFVVFCVAGLMGLGLSVAMAAEFDWYGSVRAGFMHKNTSAEKGVDLGATGNDGNAALYSRIGIKGSTELSNGQSAGVHIERGLGKDNLGTRHHNVWIGGSWGELTFGQQDNPYRSATNWDQSWTLGGNVRLGSDGGSRLEGINYSSNLAGPFSFNIFVAGNDNSNPGIVEVPPLSTSTIKLTNNPDSSTLTTDEVVADAEATDNNAANTKTIDRLTATAHYDFGVATVNLGHTKVDETEHLALSVNGSASGFGYYVAYERVKVNNAKANVFGLFLSADIGDSDKVYLEHEQDGNVAKIQATLVGYSHSLGDGVTFISEYVTVKANKAKTLNLLLKYDF